MKTRRGLAVLAMMVMMPAALMAQSYKNLWKQADEADHKDQPRTQIEVLEKIAKKALKEKEYGQLLKARLLIARTWNDISPDSLDPAIARIEACEADTKDPLLKAVLNCVLAKAYDNTSRLFSEGKRGNRAQAVEQREKAALADVELLGRTKVSVVAPIITEGSASKYFNNDLLSLICHETDDYQTLHDYHDRHGNRQGALLTALELLHGRNYGKYLGSERKQELDSLENLYGDLTMCGQVAVERDNFMSRCSDVSVKMRLDAIDRALNRWGDWPETNTLRNRKNTMLCPQFSLRIPQTVFLPSDSVKASLVDLRNLTQLQVTVTQLALPGDHELNINAEKDAKAILDSKKPGTERNIYQNIVGRADYEVFDDSMNLGTFSPGVYLMEVNTTPKTVTRRTIFHVTDVFPMRLDLPKGEERFAVVNATTGKPLNDADVKLRVPKNEQYWQKNFNIVNKKTDQDGEVVYAYGKYRPHSVFAYTADDNACPPLLTGSPFRFYNNKGSETTAEVYTDRAIYRPGQTVQAAVLVHNTNGDETSVVTGEKVMMSLRDANYKEVDRQLVTTDDFGTATASFTLPRKALNGRYTIQTDIRGGATSFSVEEYKRPTFEIIFPEITKKYKNTDTMLVHTRVKSYAGIPVQGAKVTYTIRRSRAYWWWRSYDRGTVMKTDSTVTDSDGAFWLPFDLTLPETEETLARTRLFYNFRAEVKVTNMSGETHEATLNIPLGSRPAVLTTTMPDRIERDSIKTLQFDMRNAAGNLVDAEVKYWFEDNPTVFTCRSGKLTNVKLPKFIKNGRHHLTAVCEGDTLRKDVIIFDVNDRKPCFDTNDWCYASSDVFPADGGSVAVQVGCSSKDTYIYYTVFAGNEMMEKGMAKTTDEFLVKRFKYEEKYGDGILVNFAWVRNGRAYSHQVSIKKPLPKKTLKLEWSTFRNRLTPGQSEEWTVSVKDLSGKPAKAQLTATMFDRSLDDILRHNWGLGLSLYRCLPTASWNLMTRMGRLSLSGSAAWKAFSVTSLTWTQLISDLFEFHTSYHLSRGGFVEEIPMLMNAAVKEKVVMKSVATADEEESRDEMKEAAPKKKDADNNDDKQVQVRENLNETALFQPQLLTDAKGQVKVKFTLPECLTTWRFIGLAHDKEMNYGFIEGESVARKDFMVMPNIPRFLRVGDKSVITAVIANTADKKVSGTARLQLIDPETEKVLKDIQQNFSADTEKSVPVSFELEATDKMPSLLICKVTATGKTAATGKKTATGGTFSDGEQHYLPVLPNKQLVVNTMPITQHKAGKAEVDLKKLFTDGYSNGKLTVEYTNNPAWLMVQALPAMATPHNDCVICQATAFYSNTLASTILKFSPKMKNVIETWRREAQGESLKSNLEKNEELKQVVLAETPWVADADREADQKRRLINYFDETLLAQNGKNELEKLEELQNSDGSWSWFKGMKGNRYMTTEVAELLVRLKALTGESKADKMLKPAFKFLAAETAKLVEDMKKDEKKGNKPSFPGTTTLHYLYITSLYKPSLTDYDRKNNDYLLAQLKKAIKEQDIYDKALTAIILEKNGNHNMASEYAKSLKEFTVMTEEKGRYYDTGRASYSWKDYRIPTQVAAIEALKTVLPADTVTINEMLRWLLQQKRTQIWDTNINSVNAVYAFLHGNLKVLDKGENAVLAVDGKTMEMSPSTAGLGYEKAAVSYNGQRTFTATKTSNGTSWGAVYAQMLMPLDKIEATSSGITVTRKIGRTEKLKVGDKVKVVITIKADRDYDFIEVVDKRAACCEPATQLSGYNWMKGYYASPTDCSTNYFFDSLSKGTHIIETEYYIDRPGSYQYGPVSVQCAYSPEFNARSTAETLTVEQ